MRKNTFLSAMLIAASVSVANAQEAPKELFWQNTGNTGTWSVMDSEWGEDVGVPGFLMPTGWQPYGIAIFNGEGAFADAEDSNLESIKLSGEISVTDIKFNSDKNYAVSYKEDKANDKIVGEGALLKEGSGEFVLNVLNELKGGTIVREGRVTLQKTDSPNVFGDTIVLDGGAIGLAPATISNSFKCTVPISIPEGKTGSIWAGRYAQLAGNIYGKGTLVIYTGGERVYVTDDKAGKKDMPWDDFEGDLVLDVNTETASGKPGYCGLMLNTTKTFEGVNEMTGIDSTLVNKKVTLMADAGFSSASGIRCYAIGELNAEDGGFLSGYGAGGSTTPNIYYAIGCSNTDVTLPLWLRDNRNDNKNKFGVIKVGSGTYVFTGTKNAATGSCFQGLHVKEGRAYVNIPVDDATITALCRSGKTAMAIYAGAIGGGNGRITSEVLVDGGTLEVGYQGIGQLILEDIEGETLKSPLTVKNGGVVEFEIASATSYDKLTTNSTATFNGNKIIVKAAESFDIKDGDTFTILDAAVKPSAKDESGEPIEDTYSIEFQGFPSSVTLKAEKEEYQSGTKTEGEGDEAVQVPVMGYRIIVKATGSGSGTGIEVSETNEEVFVSVQNGNIVVSGAEVENVTVLNNQGVVVANSNSAYVSMNSMKGMYIVKVKTEKGIVVRKIVL